MKDEKERGGGRDSWKREMKGAAMKWLRWRKTLEERRT
jgi:hypothetical protein